jgi:hypothetical protein
MRVLLVSISLAALAACQTRVPDSGAGVGFTDYSTYQSGETARASAVPDGQPVSGETIASGVVQPTAISDEQDFQAVSARETIASDAARLAEVRAQYEVVEPGALPERETASEPSIVEFALATTNPVGRQIYRRSGFLADRRFAKNCAEYASPDQAQEEFLRRGGPERDSKGLDPDGDGYACYWDPEPFRTARNTVAVDNVPVATE